MKNKSAIVIGWINTGKPADCGETMKNQLMIQKLEELGVHCYQVDFKGWKKHPWVFLYLLWCMIFHHNSSIIFSSSTVNVYPMMKLMKKVGWKQHAIHWVIGGSLGNQVLSNIYSKDIIGNIDWTIVESKIMVKQLTEAGVDNVIHLPNFKPIKYYPLLDSKIESLKNKKHITKFVFLSRIMGEKGCDYILEVARQLNSKGYQDRYIIDFYGKVAEAYKTIFNKKIGSLENVNYKGFLNLREKEGYDQLSEYDLMLFPTYWSGEGFAGVFIDAFVSGVPMIASDWAHNRQFMEEGKTALFIPVHNIPALRDKMIECIEGRYDLAYMAVECQKYADTYNVDNVVTTDLLKKIGIIA